MVHESAPLGGVICDCSRELKIYNCGHSGCTRLRVTRGGCLARVWVFAPNVEQVELLLADQRVLLERADEAHFIGPELTPGTDYRFSLNGGPGLPDPRSRWQPYGVHGASRCLDPHFDFSDSGFRAPPLGSAVMYELHVGTFSVDGTFEGVIPRLPHLKQLGVSHVELMPIAEFPGKRGWGYDGVFQFAAHSGYGGPIGLKRLVDACHAHGLAVILDVVYNHFGPDGNYLPQFGPYLTDTFHTPWGAAVNLDGPQSHHVRRYFIDSALQWLEEFHVDALRLDAVHSFFDRSARHFLRQLADEVAELSLRMRKPLQLIAESDLNDARLIRSAETGGYGLDAQWSDDLHHALHVTLTGERSGIHGDFDGLLDLARALERGFVYDGRISRFRQRPHGAPLTDVSLRKLVVCLQNHDQVGNRAAGERIGQLIPTPRALLGAAVVLLGPSIPLLFQGEEWNSSAPFQYFTDHQDPGLAAAVSNGRRREFEAFGWRPEAVPDPQAPATYEASRLDFSEIDRPEHAFVLRTYTALIALRKDFPQLSSAEVRAHADARAGTLLLERERSLVGFNFSTEPRPISLAHTGLLASAKLIFQTEGATLQGADLLLPPNALAVLVHAP